MLYVKGIDWRVTRRRHAQKRMSEVHMRATATLWSPATTPDYYKKHTLRRFIKAG